MKIINFIRKSYSSISNWVDKNFGAFLTNPKNLHRWEERHGKKNS